MKKLLPFFLIFCLIITAFTTAFIFVTEKTDPLGMGKLTPSVSFKETDGEMVISWDKLPYPCFYAVETYCPTTGITTNEPEERLIDRRLTSSNSCIVAPTAVPVIYKISAYGVFGRLESPFIPVPHPFFKDPISPTHITHYTSQNPASIRPFFLWHSVPKAVCYEIEILSGKPENENGTELSKEYRLVSTSKVYTNGWQADLKDYAAEPTLYWRVRALDIRRQPVGVFSTAEPLVIDRNAPIPNKPMLNEYDKMPNDKLLLYPAYHWIPLHDVNRYEVELLSEPPTTENGTEPSPNPIWRKLAGDTFSCYDEKPRNNPGEYYWRVRAVDAAGETIGEYSDTAHYTIAKPSGRIFAAAFGDSITHGGGSVSYSPSSREYDYTSYLDFEAYNLGKSGDTTDTSLKRFDKDVLPFKPLNLLIMTGTNDLRVNRPIADMIDDLEKIKQKCIENDIRPIFLTLMPINPQSIRTAFGSPTVSDWHQRLDRYNEFIRKQEYFIDLEPYFYDADKTVMSDDLAIDGLHPDIRGKMLMAEIINAHQNLLRKEKSE